MKKVLILLFILITCDVYSQHSNQYSQYMFNGLVINPAYAGSNKVLSATLLYRDQWVGLEGAPKTTTFSLHTPLRNKKVNVGLSVMSDHYGVTTKNTINAVYAYRINFNSSSLAFGINGGVELITDHWDNVQTAAGSDPVFTGQQEKYTNPEAGFGLYFKSEKLYAGLSSPVLIQTNKLSKKIFRPAFLSAGYLFTLSEDYKIKPSILMKYIRNSPIETDLNVNGYYKEFGLGISYRTRDAVVLMLQYVLKDQLTIGYSYDLTLTKLKTYSNGSHELMLKYEFGYKVKAKSPRYF